MIIYISNQIHRGIGNTKKLLHTRTRENAAESACLSQSFSGSFGGKND